MNITFSKEKQESTVSETLTEAAQRDYAFEAYITNLEKYNEGELVGKWVKFPITNEEMKNAFKRIGINSSYEEWFISDYDCPDINGLTDLLSEHENLSELNYLAGQIMELDEGKDFFQAALDLGKNTDSVKDLINLTENMDCINYISGVTSDYDLGYYLIETSGCYDTAAMGELAEYIDYESFGRDACINDGGCYTNNGYISLNGNIVEIYNGNLESIPDRFRIGNEEPNLLTEEQRLIGTVEQSTVEPIDFEIAEPMDMDFDMNM